MVRTDPASPSASFLTMPRFLIPFVSLLLVLPLVGKERRIRNASSRQVPPRKRPAKAPVAHPAESEAALRERVERKVNALLYGLKPSVASRVKTATMPFQTGRLDGAPVDVAWRTAEESVRSAFGAGLRPDQLEALTTLVVGLGAAARPGAKSVPLLARVSDRLQARQGGLQASIDSIR